ncbi:phosphate ABC transporter substrate-binding protein [Paraburkholderia tropica]|uniref:phosphate ABC transporter substrate-binding protein n=1 Tax=Paraburkholderia tropica TaxID=92647 RepID=UPI0007EE207F|nr:phosphate ABC transporter substrate-binding protein [Paraburkholderia tropica]OBR50021.1 phosphate ABC transporter substrate-binding protein [Paraburkholderia tropica]
MSMIQTEKPVLRANLDVHPMTRAMRDGRVTTNLVELDYCGPAPAHIGFKAMLQDNAYDAGELAIVTFLQARAYGKPFVLLPVPILGRLQHHCAVYNARYGVIGPKDIEGKKVGVRSYAQTTGLWIRGVLQHEYGVDPARVQWTTLEDGHLAEYSDPPGCDRLPHGTSIAQRMLDGELAAALLGAPDMPKDPDVRTLIPDAHEAAKDWFAREGVVPINHMFVVHEDLSRHRPDIVRELHRMLAESRALAQDLPAIFPPIGFEANRKCLQLAIDWALEQKIIARRLSVDELFDDVTANL